METNSTLGDLQGLSAISGLHRVQKTHDNGYLAYVDAPALGFKKHTSAALKTPLPAGSLSVKQVAGMFVWFFVKGMREVVSHGILHTFL